MKIIVYHASYGCDSGCCGHIVEVDGKEVQFMFEHPYGKSRREFVHKVVTEACGEDHVKDIDWENCVISDDGF